MSAVCINKARRVRHADAVTWFYHLTRLLLTRNSPPLTWSPLFNFSIRFIPNVCPACGTTEFTSILTTGPRRQKTNGGGCSFWLRPDQRMALRLEKPNDRNRICRLPHSAQGRNLSLGVSFIERKIGKTGHFPSFCLLPARIATLFNYSGHFPATLGRPCHCHHFH